ncbi:MAG: AMP-binding protein [Opitutales bacterium]|nr:AMP-binding protein [Opitutales bacterium]
MQILIATLSEKEIVLLDSDFTESEIESLTNLQNGEYSEMKIARSYDDLKSVDELVLRLDTIKNAKITFFTSGTTGRPKKVSHTLQSITRFTKRKSQHSLDIWGFAYNPTHIAGVQVFFQALLNKNKIVRLFGLSIDEIFGVIEKEKITHISATPTFYRMLIWQNVSFDFVKRITSGGEKFDKKTSTLLAKIFPNAKITNVYASTEVGTLFASQDDVFVVKNEVKNLVKIIDNELLLHESLLGQTADLSLMGQWYRSGDLVEVVAENPLSIKFVARQGEMINVGGYKVNPSEVEDAILSLTSVSQVRVFGKKNSVLGNVICAEVVAKSLDEKSIRDYLKMRLQEFKIPRIIKFVKDIKLTRTLKTSRK